MTMQEILDNILHAVFGREVRQSLHDGVKRANDICDDTEGRQTELERKYDLLLRNCTELSPSDAEIVDARIQEDGMAYETLGERLNELDNTLGEKVSSKLFDELSESVIELNELLERYLPRTSNLTMEVDTSVLYY